MAFPTDLDNFTPKVDNTDDVMAIDINELQTAIESMEAKIGANASAVETSHDYKIATLETNNTGINTGDQVAGDFAHDSLSTITGTAGQYNHPTDAQISALHGVNDANTSSATAAQGTLATNALPKAGGTMTGDILGAVSYGATGTRITKVWATNIESTSEPTVGGNQTKLLLAGGTMTGKIVKAGTTEVGKTYTPATGAQSVALDCVVNNIHEVTGHADGTAITFTVANATSSQPFIVSILQGAVVSTITGWFATIRWAGGSAPTLTATVGKRDTFGFIRTGANTYDGFIIGANC